MKVHVFLLILALVWRPAGAQDLPDLGDASQSTLSPLQELRYGAAVMRQIRSSSVFLADVEVTDYIGQIGYGLVAKSPDPGGHFEFFVMNDKSINAFALPGGYIGVHSGLMLAAQSESEMVGVIGHEIAHVTQRHIARMMAAQKKTGLASLAALAVAILAAQSSPELAQAAILASQALPLQSALSFSRDNEREADRIGLQIVQKSNYDVHAIPVFFERLQRASRVYEGGAPSYLRTHPLTFERIADIQSRTSDLPYRQVPDSLDFHLVRARLLALDGRASDAVLTFKKRIDERKSTSELASRYGLVVAMLRMEELTENDIDAARVQVDQMREQAPDHPMILALAAELEARSGEMQPALEIYRQGLALYPTRKALVYGYSKALMDTGQARQAAEFLD
ncbi:MAG TPA: M48 family metalloprotease, partial [Burkholderiales bacterium]|nr:M48 family metalloprotease [Burkholderiales bacterium]